MTLGLEVHANIEILHSLVYHSDERLPRDWSIIFRKKAMVMSKHSLSAILMLLLAGTAHAGDGAKKKQGAELRVEYTLKTPRGRDPVLGGARDKAFVSVWIPEGVKTVRGAICNPFSKGDSVSAHWQAACRHWKFAYVQVDFDAVKKTSLFSSRRDFPTLPGHRVIPSWSMCRCASSACRAAAA
jgi:hypothetical protein